MDECFFDYAEQLLTEIRAVNWNTCVSCSLKG